MYVNGNTINTFGNLSIQNQTFERINANGKCDLDNITCTGPLICSGNAQVKNSHLNKIKLSGDLDLQNCTANNITTSGHFYASNCLKMGVINASGQAYLVNCEDVQGIISSGSLSLLTTRVNGDVVHLGKDVHITDSTITGKLECRDNRIIIDNSSINEIFVKRDHEYSFEQIVELIGKNCVVDSISFEEGCTGRVILKDGAQFTGNIQRGVVESAPPN